MAYKKSQLNKVIKQIIKALSKKIPIDKIILFGSYAHGRPRKRSDIDLAIVSKEFRNMDDISRLKVLLPALKGIHLPYLVDIDLLGFTSEELENADYFDVSGEIIRKGQLVYSK